MSFEEELNRLLKEKEALSKKITTLNSDWDKLDNTIGQLSEEERVVDKKMRELRAKYFDEGFEQWKECLTEEELHVPPYTFQLSQEEMLKAKYLHTLHTGNSGAVGGGTTYEFTPTGLGTIVTLRLYGKEYDLTDSGLF